MNWAPPFNGGVGDATPGRIGSGILIGEPVGFAGDGGADEGEPVGFAGYARADKSAVGAINRPLRAASSGS